MLFYHKMSVGTERESPCQDERHQKGGEESEREGERIRHRVENDRQTDRWRVMNRNRESM